MASLSIHNIDEHVLKHLSARAKMHGHTLQVEVKRILEAFTEKAKPIEVNQPDAITIETPEKEPLYAAVQPVKATGKPPSEMLIEDRR